MKNIKLKSGIELNLSELTDEDREAIVKALEETKSGVWKPKDGETYYYLGYGGHVMEEYFSDTWENDSGRVAVGNYFKTKDEAKKHLTYLKALQVLRGDTKGYEWKYGDEYYYVYASSLVPVMKTGHSKDRAFGDVIKFKNDMDASESIVHHTKEWKIVLLGVE